MLRTPAGPPQRRQLSVSRSGSGFFPDFGTHTGITISTTRPLCLLGGLNQTSGLRMPPARHPPGPKIRFQNFRKLARRGRGVSCWGRPFSVTHPHANPAPGRFLLYGWSFLRHAAAFASTPGRPPTPQNPRRGANIDGFGFRQTSTQRAGTPRHQPHGKNAAGFCGNVRSAGTRCFSVTKGAVIFGTPVAGKNPAAFRQHVHGLHQRVLQAIP